LRDEDILVKFEGDETVPVKQHKSKATVTDA
jgi:hypothetical protein